MSRKKPCNPIENALAVFDASAQEAKRGDDLAALLATLVRDRDVLLQVLEEIKAPGCEAFGPDDGGTCCDLDFGDADGKPCGACRARLALLARVARIARTP